MTFTMNSTTALALYPGLQPLLNRAPEASPPWKFTEWYEHNSGTALFAARVWPDRTLDTLGVKTDTQARVVRTNPLGERVFECIDTLAVVVEVILDQLVDPDDPLAPKLVLPRVVAGYVSPAQLRQLTPH